MKFRAILHKPKNGVAQIESIWVDDEIEARRMGASGLLFYGGTNYTIEESDNPTEQDDNK